MKKFSTTKTRNNLKTKKKRNKPMKMQKLKKNQPKKQQLKKRKKPMKRK